ncbi:unnamed protein product [Durusdinium trenchii]|uniref:Trichohyalin-plectin-homology domain-containing protein n=1 Tax=Durusdinium trenchii TaxID=1381693 RepID=A0ABP0ME92_9DINO
MSQVVSRGRTPLKSASAPSIQGSTKSTQKTLNLGGQPGSGLSAGACLPDDVKNATTGLSAEPHPLKQAEWDPRAFVDEEMRREQQQWAALQKYRDGLAKQIEENKVMRQARRDEHHDLVKTITAETLKMQVRENKEKEELSQKRRKMRQNLDEQMALQEERAKEARLHDLLEGAEVKAQSMQLLYEEVEAQKKRKEDMKKRGDEMRQEVARRAMKKSDNRQQDREDMLAKMRSDDLQEEYRQAMKLERLRAHQARSDAREAHYFETAGRELDLRNSQEAERQDRDERQHNLRLDLHYSRREAARKQQLDKVLGEMRQQLGASDDQRGLDRLRQEKERHALSSAARIAAETDLQKHRQKRTAELEMQAELAKMMMEKQQREKDGLDGPKSRITALCSMAIDQAFVDMTIARASGKAVPKSDKPMHQVDASKDLSKPLGKPRVKPWVDIAKSHGPGGVVGVFGGDGRVHQSLMATGGARRILTDAAARKTWSEGISADKMKEGQKAAEQRHLAQLHDKSDSL